MSSSDEEDDKFLYGSDTENDNTSTGKRTFDEANGNHSDVQVTNKKPKVLSASTLDLSKPSETSSSTSDEDSDGEESDYDSDFDIEFIISAGPDTSRLDSMDTTSISTATTTPIPITTTTTTELPKNAISVASDEVLPDNLIENDVKAEPTPTATGYSMANDESSTITSDSLKNNKTMLGSIDLDKDGLFEGEPITNIDPEVLREKPWRQPGANLSDYFNYGFNEFTWLEYLKRHEKLRIEYNPRRILMGLLSLQQQGKLDPQNTTTQNNDTTNVNNNMIPNNMSPPKQQQMTQLNQQSQKQPPLMPPVGFPPMPMFGGFPPFGMPNMMAPLPAQFQPSQGLKQSSPPSQFQQQQQQQQQKQPPPNQQQINK
ncbi:cleavage polyadenylation factor subunit FIP1 NDAI_0D00530 [Naumovozyma dairenensis CBS 421]|uniref:Pre-mRNA polyadenylation factor FIP1 n=1 Tax=Naumovozyma dairenensis (strain ATCC 10597 / BCRC 20456 / CBS 421 / NBRC 0211 / NRRL Y-12639) TaxID=1071378 RepID=G0W9A6_NAUDC|nr:hypothetical protein NDAI_0D00530 [Naumovozyma dairenensis CBS 421]CCD24367.1 hypothetical protein NDAI_0D00530 [Naumovozyma dairenensis CBS 421]